MADPALDGAALRMAQIWAKTMSEWEVESNVLRRVLKAAKARDIMPYLTDKKPCPVVYTPLFKLLYNEINASPQVQAYRKRALSRWYEVYLEDGYERFSNSESGPKTLPNNSGPSRRRKVGRGARSKDG